MSSSTERKQYQRQENHDCSVVNQRYLQEKSYKWLWVSIIWFHENNQIDERIWFKHLEDYEAESLRDVSVSSMQNEVFCLLYIFVFEIPNTAFITFFVNGFVYMIWFGIFHVMLMPVFKKPREIFNWYFKMIFFKKSVVFRNNDGQRRWNIIYHGKSE